MLNKFSLLAAALLMLCGRPAAAQSIAEALRQAEADVESSRLELNALRDRVQSERDPLALRRLELLRETASLREELTGLRISGGEGGEGLERLTRDAEHLQGEREFLENLLSEYRRGLETRAGAAEADFLRGRLPDDHPELEDLAAVDKFFAGSLDWQRRRRQGYVWSGGVLDETGRERVGVLAVLGPLSYFAGQEGEAGMLIGRSNQFLPGLLTFKSPAEIEALRAFIAGSEAQVPVDVSLGDAVKLREARLSPGERLRQGGMVMVPLLGIGVLALVLSVLKLWDLHRLRVRLEPSQLEWFREKEESRMAAQLQEAEQVPQAVGPLLTAALRHRRASREHLEEILHEQVLAALPRLERSLGALAVFGGIAPLLGLLGTVTGMIHTFQMVTLFGTGNARTLSGGISEALVTTAAGLIIAIPVLLVHAFLARRAKLKLAELEQTAVLLVNLLKSDAPEADGCRP